MCNYLWEASFEHVPGKNVKPVVSVMPGFHSMTAARFAQIVMGPAGSGKSTYIRRVMEHFEVTRRTVHAVNLDPAADELNYPATIDIRDVYSVAEAMEEHGFGPNGALVFCMEQIAQDFTWFDNEIGDHDYDFLLIDLPGQIELFCHLDILPRLFKHLESLDYNMCGIFLIDSQFMIDPAKFLSGCLAALSAMTMIAIPYVNVLSKCDLLTDKQRHKLDMFIEMHTTEVGMQIKGNPRLSTLTEKICALISQYNMLDFFPLDPTDGDDVVSLMAKIDTILHYEDYADFIENEVEDEVDPDQVDLGKVLEDD